MLIEELKNCSGCHACFSVCAKSAILMEENYEGFLYPVIDKEKCVECGLCEKVCPSIEPLKKENENTKSFAAINKNEKIRLDSSSGGIFSAIAEKVIDEGGIVFGAKFAEDFSVVHGWAETKEDIAEFRGSKYLQSVIGNSYKDCKNFLLTDRKVLFSGTPCQIQGLKKYLGKEYDNLITVDFICHGVPSPSLWKKYIEYREKKSASRTVKTAFRRKNDGWKQFSVSFTFANDTEYCASLKKDSYIQIFLKDIALRDSCYECSCRGITRPSDITLADFWGIQYVLPEMDDDKGTSFVVCNSKKGLELFEKNLLDKCTIREVNINDGIKYNISILTSPIRPPKRRCFYHDLNILNFNKMIMKYANTSFFIYVFRFIKKCYRKILRILNRK